MGEENMGEVKEKGGKSSALKRAGAPDSWATDTDRVPTIFDSLAEPVDALASDVDSDRPRARNLEALLDVSKAINSTLVLDDILKRVMRHAIALLNAERGFLMLLDDNGQLQVRTAHNINKETFTTAEDFLISRSVANRVAARGQSEYTSNAQEDPRYAHQQSVAELNLRFIICVPLKIKDTVIGVCYLDNQSRAGLFGKSDLRLFELFAEQAAIAIENAKLYERLLSLTRYNENVVNKTPVGICVLDYQLRILTFNAAAEQIFHAPEDTWTAGSLVQEHRLLVEILPPSEREWWDRTLTEVVRSHKPLAKDKYFITIGGCETVLSLKISPLNGIPGEPPKVIVVAEEITDQVMLEKYVILSEKMVAKGEMAAAIGHELNNHLEILQAHSELLPIHLRGSRLDKLSESCARIQDSIENMARFTRGLMDYTQIDTELVEHDIKDLVEEHLFTIRPLRLFSSVRFTCDFAPGLPPVKLDAGQLQSVLLNLYNNAVDATPSGETCAIHIQARHRSESQTVELSIRDNGPGIAPEHLTRVFEPRFTTKRGGHGLGLSNCRTIIQNHGGTIRVESTPGHGATFSIELPAHRPYSSFGS
ncbi:MAG: ATP-binding protein [Candidatus Zixiibacteriota bacterium]